MSSNLFIGLTAALSVVGLSGSPPPGLACWGRTTARPPPPIPPLHRRGRRDTGLKSILKPETPDPCEAEPATGRIILNGTKPTPRMLAPQRDDHLRFEPCRSSLVQGDRATGAGDEPRMWAGRSQMRHRVRRIGAGCVPSAETWVTMCCDCVGNVDASHRDRFVSVRAPPGALQPSGPSLSKKISYRAAGALLLATSIAALMGSPAAAYDGSGADYLAYDGGLTLVGPDAGDLGPSIGSGFGSTSLGRRSTASRRSTFAPCTAASAKSRPTPWARSARPSSWKPATAAYAVYDKATGAQQLLSVDGSLLGGGRPARVRRIAGDFSNGDSRVLYDSQLGRSGSSNPSPPASHTIQIAVSTTSDALGPWKSTTFTGFAGGIADYPTLAIDNKAVYIGTNDFSGAAGNPFEGTTLNVICAATICSARPAPTATSLKQFFTPLRRRGRRQRIAATPSRASTRSAAAPTTARSSPSASSTSARGLLR